MAEAPGESGQSEVYAEPWDRVTGRGVRTSGESLESREALLVQTPLWTAYGAGSLGGQFSSCLEATL